MGLSRNKVAVPEGAAGTSPFWSEKEKKLTESAAELGLRTMKVHFQLDSSTRTRIWTQSRFLFLITTIDTRCREASCRTTSILNQMRTTSTFKRQAVTLRGEASTSLPYYLVFYPGFPIQQDVKWNKAVRSGIHPPTAGAVITNYKLRITSWRGPYGAKQSNLKFVIRN